MSATESQSAPLLPAAEGAGEKGKTGMLATAGVAGLLASVCCVGPLAAVTPGLGGAVASGMVAFEPYRPVFIGIALLALGYSGWKIYRKPAQACEPGTVCALPKAIKMYRSIFWLVAAPVLGSIASPYLAPLFY